jgi:hypothetical protein
MHAHAQAVSRNMSLTPDALSYLPFIAADHPEYTGADLQVCD